MIFEDWIKKRILGVKSITKNVLTDIATSEDSRLFYKESVKKT